MRIAFGSIGDKKERPFAEAALLRQPNFLSFSLHFDFYPRRGEVSGALLRTGGDRFLMVQQIVCGLAAIGGGVIRRLCSLEQDLALGARLKFRSLLSQFIHEKREPS